MSSASAELGERIGTVTKRRTDDNPDGPFCHILTPDQKALCGAELSSSRMRQIHFLTECPRKGCIRCPDCERLSGGG